MQRFLKILPLISYLKILATAATKKAFSRITAKKGHLVHLIQGSAQFICSFDAYYWMGHSKEQTNQKGLCKLYWFKMAGCPIVASKT